MGEIPSYRRRVYCIGDDQILAMFNRQIAWLIEHDLPEDATAVHSWSDPMTRGIYVLVESSEFDPVPANHEYPRHHLISLKMHGVPVDVLQQAAQGIRRRAKDWAFLCDTPIRGIESSAKVTFTEFLTYVIPREKA